MAGEVVDKVQETVGRITGSGDGTDSSSGGQSTPIFDQATEQITSRLDMGKELVVGTMTEVSQALRKTGQQLRDEGAQPMLAQYVDRGAEQIERVSGHMRQRDANELLAEVEWFARRQPMVFAGGTFALGMLAVRFLKSGGRQQTAGSSSMSSGQSFTGATRTTVGTGQASPSATTRPPGYAGAAPGAASASPGAPATSAPARTPSAGSGIGSGTGTGTQAPPRATPGTPSEPPTPRPASPPSGGSIGGAGTTTPRPISGSGTPGQSGSSPSSAGRAGTGSRNQP